MKLFIFSCLLAISFAQTAAVACTLPQNQPVGYSYGSSPSLSSCTSATNGCASPSFSDVSCASGYYSPTTIDTTGCTNLVTTVALTGCDLDVACTLPSFQLGYSIAGGATLSACFSQSCATATTTGVTCATGWHTNGGTISTSSSGCTSSSTAATLTGCVLEIICVLPTSFDEGFVVDVNATLSDCTSAACNAPVLEGLECAPKYVGDIAVTQCTQSEAQVSLAGCADNRRQSTILWITLIIVSVLMIIISVYSIVPYIQKKL